MQLSGRNMTRAARAKSLKSRRGMACSLLCVGAIYQCVIHCSKSPQGGIPRKYIPMIVVRQTGAVIRERPEKSAPRYT